MRLITSRVSQSLLIGLVALVMLFLLFDFIIMPAYTRQGNEMEVPDLIGLSLEAAQIVASQQGFQLIIDPPKLANRGESDTILEQRPLAKSLSKPGRKIHVVPAKLAEIQTVPYLVGLGVRDAQIRCRNIGLICGQTEVSYQFSKMTEKGLVLEQIPAEGEQIEPGSTMRLIVSLGEEPESIHVPELIEKPLHDARLALIEAGLELGRVSRKETDVYTAGTVIAQSIRTGSKVSRGTRVDLVVAVPVPVHEETEPAPEQDSEEDE
ncbi:PASTA domain-containing protein [bacterium]|nr:PASTA domain-containing protein [bacterium]